MKIKTSDFRVAFHVNTLVGVIFLVSFLFNAFILHPGAIKLARSYDFDKDKLAGIQDVALLREAAILQNDIILRLCAHIDKSLLAKAIFFYAPFSLLLFLNSLYMRRAYILLSKAGENA